MEGIDVETCETYYAALMQIEAQEMLQAIKISSYPHMREEPQSELHRSIHKQAYPLTHSGPPIGPQDLAKMLKLGRV